MSSARVQFKSCFRFLLLRLKSTYLAPFYLGHESASEIVGEHREKSRNRAQFSCSHTGARRERLRIEPAHKPGLLHGFTDDYLARVEAVEFASLLERCRRGDFDATLLLKFHRPEATAQRSGP